MASACWPRNRFSSGLASAIKHNQTLSRYRLTQDGGDRPYVLVHGRRGPVVVGDQGEDGAHGEEDGLLGVVGPGNSRRASAIKSEFEFQRRRRRGAGPVIGLYTHQRSLWSLC